MTTLSQIDINLLEELSSQADELYVTHKSKQKRIQVSNLKNVWSANQALCKKVVTEKLERYRKLGGYYNRPSVNHDHNTRIQKIKKESTVQNWRKLVKFPEVAKLPPARLYNYTPFNVHVEDQKALDHIPYFDDETATEGNPFIQDIIDLHDGNIHSAMIIDDDDFFIDLVRRLSKSVQHRDSPSPTKKRSNINSALSISDIVYQAISHAFPSEGSSVDVKNRYTKLITSKPPCYNPNIDSPDAKSTDRLKSLHTYKTLFCRRCLIYDCHLHTREQDLSPEKLSTITIRNRGEFIDQTPAPLHPCSENCFMHIIRNCKDSPENTTTALTKAEESIIRSEWVSSPANFCLLRLFTLRKSVTCTMIYTWCKKNIPEFNIFMDSGCKYISRPIIHTNGHALTGIISCDDDSNSGNSGASEDTPSAYCFVSNDTHESKINRSNRNKRKGSSSTRGGKGKRRIRNTFHKINQLKSKLSDNSVHNYSPCVDHIGEECSNDCECIINGHGCEKYCLCSSKCQYRMPGCVCSGNCTTGQCPCFKASRECDPDLCKSCGASDFNDPKCCNVALQRKKKKHLLIAPSDLGFEAGWGCFTKDRILKNELISEYCGELISQVEADRRGMIYDKYKLSYLFQLNSEFAVDATVKGNKIRFANHSVTPNCYAKIFSVIGEHRIGIFAARDIEEGEELFFDYKYGNNERLTFVPIEQHVPINGKSSQTPKTPSNGHQSCPPPKLNGQAGITTRNYAIKSAVKINIPGRTK